MVKFDEGENIVRIVRRHWFVILGGAVILIILGVIPGLIIYGLNFSDFVVSAFKAFFGSTGFENNAGIDSIFSLVKEGLEWQIFAYALWLLILWTFFFVEWTDYYLDVLIITNKRVINVEQKGFFNREVISFFYEQIQDITVETKGVIQTFFKFGLIQIQTAGEKRCIVIKHAEKAEEVRNEILKMQESKKS